MNKIHLLLLGLLTCSISSWAQQWDQVEVISAKTGDKVSCIHQNEAFKIKGLQQDVYLVHFTNDFFPAPPPMVEGAGGGEPMQVGKTHKLAMGDSLSLPEKGLYFIQTDTSTTEGLGLFVVPSDYPKYKKIRNLVSSMVYISTQSEQEKYISAARPKLILDNFWIKAAGDMDNARRLLRMYYTGVMEANQKFSSYKEGWKTDQGMIYVIFGKPDRITPIEGGEEWLYSSGPDQQQINFQFQKKANIFTQEHYVLVRDNSYKRLWFDAVRAWRNGQVR